jgi:hypothetical protein
MTIYIFFSYHLSHKYYMQTTIGSPLQITIDSIKNNNSFNKPLVYIPFSKNAMKILNSQASSIKMVHCNGYPQHGSDDCGLFVMHYPEKKIHNW